METAKILIVDDDADFAESTRAILESRGYQVATAGGRAEALEQVKAGPPDLILLDVMMASWDEGFELARQIRHDEATAQTRILMLTGVREKTGIGFKSAAGDPVWLPVDGFLEKPVESEALLAQVEALLRK